MKHNKNTFVIASTKGGCGKTIIASMVVPVLFANSTKKISIYSIDDNNKNKIESKFIDFHDLKTKDSAMVIDEAEIRKINNTDEVSIIDLGGGRDTTIFLETVKKSSMHGLVYIIPIADDIEQVHNLTETIKKIKSVSNDAEIYLILNQVKVMDEEAIQKQFIGIYGSQKYGIEDLNKDVLKQIKGVYFLEASPLFSILKNVYKTTLLDAFVDAEELLKELDDKKQVWATKGMEYFKKQNAYVRVAHDVIKLTNRIYTMKSIVEGES